MFSERSLIEKVLAPLTRAGSGALGLRDDAALIRPRAGHELVITQDSLQAGVHFFASDAPKRIAQKALRVNLSDLFAKGARPLGYLLSLFIPSDMDEAALRAFAEGLRADQHAYGIDLLGGDTVHSPGGLALTVTMYGEVPAGRMLRRDGARPGDHVFVSGTIGDAALGLGLLEGRLEAPAAGYRDDLIAAYHLPQPPTELGDALRTHAEAAMDISDGLAGDLGLLCAASGVSAEITWQDVPISEAAASMLDDKPDLIRPILTGGDDYQILCTVPEASADAFAQAAGDRVCEIGRIVAGQAQPRFVGPDGEALALGAKSFSHF